MFPELKGIEHVLDAAAVAYEEMLLDSSLSESIGLASWRKAFAAELSKLRKEIKEAKEDLEATQEGFD
ncbi:hypothetical protein NW767_014876 [Fusarium falciforme]|nr:hypothetical protein NW767_014876 [Fusarium falciforme]